MCYLDCSVKITLYQLLKRANNNISMFFFCFFPPLKKNVKLSFEFHSDIHKSEILYVNKASNVTLPCPFASAKPSFQWSGPPNRTSYSNNFNVNPAVKDIEIMRGSTNGVSYLIIYGFNESNEGVYQCTTTNEGKLVMHDIDVMLQISK